MESSSAHQSAAQQRRARVPAAVRASLSRCGAWFGAHRIGALVLGLLVLLVAVAWWMVASVTSALNGSHWSSATGTVGDTFGGTLGPILSFVALVTTVFLALLWQPRKETKDKAELRAESVVAWLAETHTRLNGDAATKDAELLGVVISNGSESVIFTVDLIIERSSDRFERRQLSTDLHGSLADYVVPPGPEAPNGSTTGADGTPTDSNSPSDDLSDALVHIDREALVPPGTWFLPWDDDVSPIGWRLPVAVDTTGIPTVKLEETDRSELATYTLRPHLPETNGKTHYVVSAIRYDLYGQRWKRAIDGRIARAGMWPAADEARFQNAMMTRRAAVTSRFATHDEVRHLVYTIMRSLSTAVPADESIPPNTKYEVDEGKLAGVVCVSRNQRTGVYLHLDNGAVIRFAANSGMYPDRIDYYKKYGPDEHNQSSRVLGPREHDSTTSKAITAAASRAVTTPARPATDWVNGDGTLHRDWMNLLQSVVKAARANGGNTIEGSPK